MHVDFGTYDLISRMPNMRMAVRRATPGGLDDLAGEVRGRLLASGLLRRIEPGTRIAITAGSRGIARIVEILRAVVAAVREAGGEPFLVPAMGSHGGATAEGQVQLLAGLGITGESVGAPIRATMEVVELGRLPDGPGLYMDAYAAEADGIIVVNRVKMHTSFHGAIESGLAKMAVIGLGKRHAADAMHLYGAAGLRAMIAPAAKQLVALKPFLAGVAIVENDRHEVARVDVLPPGEFGGPAEAALLRAARDLAPHLPFEQLDVLVVDEIGKDYSGTGMDTNVIGRTMVPGDEMRAGPAITAIAVLDLSEGTHGNAYGLGLADVTTRRLVSKIDFRALYTNGITSGRFGLRRTAIPFVMQDDRTAISLALHAAAAAHPDSPRLARIRNTLELDRIMISEALADEAARAGMEVGGSLGPPAFDVDGRVAGWEADPVS